MQMSIGRSTHVLWGVAKKLTLFAWRCLREDQEVSANGSLVVESNQCQHVECGPSPQPKLMQVVVDQCELVDNASTSDHEFVESESFDSDDDLEIRSEPAMGIVGHSSFVPAPSASLSDIRPKQDDARVLSDPKVAAGPKAVTPTKLLLEQLSRKQLTVEEKLAMLTSASNSITAASTIQLNASGILLEPALQQGSADPFAERVF